MSPRLIDNYLHDFTWRRTVRNWPNDVQTVVDGYRAYATVPHAVQKDAVQNSWSARTNRRGSAWKTVFELIDTGTRKYLLITDTGTTGLTGRVLSPEEYEMDLPAEEKWGRFEGVAFTQPRSERALGSRGRGKFIFVGASKETTIFYDTLRADGIYRFGIRTITPTESPVMAIDGDEGRQKLIEIAADAIPPLTEIGARVIIVEPTDEVIEDIRAGKLLQYIGETWWELIRNYEATIIAKVDGNERRAMIPEEFSLEEDDGNGFKVWIKRNHGIRTGSGNICIKNLHIVCRSDVVIPEDLRGIALQRNGMKICTVNNYSIGRDLYERIYGYVNFDPDTEELLINDEGIEHYSFDFRRSVPQAVKRYIEDEIMRFAQEKLGYGTDVRERRREQQRGAERRALFAANNFARALGIGTGPGPRREGNGGERTPKKTRIQLDEIVLPRPSDLRVNYGETVNNIRLRVVNDNTHDVAVRLRFFLRYHDRVVYMFTEDDITIRAASVSPDIGPFSLDCEQAGFPETGKYTIAARIYSLMDEDRGTELHYKTKSFYLEEDPPMHGLFEKCEAVGLPDEDPIKFWMGYSEFGSERGLVLYYNVEHPGYYPVSVAEDDLAEYILRIAGQELCRFDLMQDNTRLFTAEQRDNPQEVLIQERKIIGELVYKFRRGVL